MVSNLFEMVIINMRCFLKVFLDELGMTQKELAKKTGISEVTLSKLSKNQSIPRLDIAFKISNAIGKKVDEIWKYD